MTEPPFPPGYFRVYLIGARSIDLEVAVRDAFLDWLSTPDGPPVFTVSGDATATTVVRAHVVFVHGPPMPKERGIALPAGWS